jgi:hypothetical protein
MFHIDLGGKSAKHFVTVNSFKLGKMEATNFDLVADASPGGSDYDGILVPDPLRNFDVEIDYANKTMTLFEPHACEGLAVYWTQAYPSLPIRITDSGHARIDVTLDGKEMEAILDTGAELSPMAAREAGHLFDINPTTEEGTKAETLVGGQGGELTSYAYGFKTHSLGATTLNHPTIVLYDGYNTLRTEGAFLVLGVSELHFLDIYLAYHERQVSLSAADAH